MLDPRMTKLAETLIGYSTAMKPGEKVLIEAIDIPVEMTCELVRVAREAGADPLVLLKSNRVDRALRIHGSDSQMNLMAEVEALQMSHVDAYLGLRGNWNIAELSDVPPEEHQRYQSTVWKRVHLDI
ncbi:MAG: aminopeptidase, partial [Planctomycetes bacterium]|nr:aminopeptidase [Planctomycetota bacterium]